ncbi:PH domain-containing protein [Corynebacterium sp. 335C]
MTARDARTSGERAADPAAAADGGWVYEVTSKRMKTWGWGLAAAAIVIHLFMGAVVGVGDTGAAVTPIDVAAYPLIGVIVAACALTLTRPRVRVNDRGVEVRNFGGPRFYVWADVYGLSFPEDARCARLELPDFEFVPMWAMPASDGERTVDAVRRFRELEDRWMPED